MSITIQKAANNPAATESWAEERPLIRPACRHNERAIVVRLRDPVIQGVSRQDRERDSGCIPGSDMAHCDAAGVNGSNRCRRGHLPGRQPIDPAGQRPATRRSAQQAGMSVPQWKKHIADGAAQPGADLSATSPAGRGGKQHWRDRMLSSVSAMLSQLPCFGV
jgi:hypothetical protein